VSIDGKEAAGHTTILTRAAWRHRVRRSGSRIRACVRNGCYCA